MSDARGHLQFRGIYHLAANANRQRPFYRTDDGCVQISAGVISLAWLVSLFTNSSMSTPVLSSVLTLSCSWSVCVEWRLSFDS